ncbi:MAG: DUF2892 domain-containing protein [Bdellovibrionales bacterium]|nr:DUF2892 domain-containing protein [Bdellovibrionales bacterium]
MRNIVFWDRCLRGLLGVFLLSWAFAGGPTWSFLGLYFLATGAWGFCPVYWSLSVNSSSRTKK